MDFPLDLLSRYSLRPELLGVAVSFTKRPLYFFRQTADFSVVSPAPHSPAAPPRHHFLARAACPALPSSAALLPPRLPAFLPPSSTNRNLARREIKDEGDPFPPSSSLCRLRRPCSWTAGPIQRIEASGRGAEGRWNSEEEFQMQLAMALSTSNSDLVGDRDGDQIRDAKLMSLGAGDHRFRAAGRDNGHTAELLSRRYWVSVADASFQNRFAPNVEQWNLTQSASLILSFEQRCVPGPTALFFRSCSHLVVDDLEVRDSMQMHVVIAYCWKVLVSRLFVTAPGWSPNTDGIHVSNSREVSIIDSTITTGDDCISIVSGSEFVRATGIFCGPGHGISIGSLGANKSRAHVSDVLVEKATLVGTTSFISAIYHFYPYHCSVPLSIISFIRYSFAIAVLLIYAIWT
ncbi:hypothetical protein QYE76_052343 [Lolium multiflorum]|uniref:Polygalacturonase n=1 Tax=Lolium multiflorum TaxID=4521 RepID=A0AAD8SUU7_LOLMU|nr:hypothetical protein QYE76_052343 [Lolium multiflorum]